MFVGSTAVPYYKLSPELINNNQILSLMQSIEEKFKEFRYFTANEIKEWYQKLFETGVQIFSKSSLTDPCSIPSQVRKLYYATAKNRLWVDAPGGYHNALMAIHPKTKERLFIIKSDSDNLYDHISMPKEKSGNFGIPQNNPESIVERTQLYYMLDREHFAGVPPTFLISMDNRYYSFQLYVPHEKCFEIDRKTLEIAELSLRKCAIHNYRTVNMDFNNGNILWANQTAVPVDGSFILPCVANPSKSAFELVGKEYTLACNPYLNRPFSLEEKAYIERIDIQKDLLLLDALVDDEEASTHEKVCKIFTVSNRLLKEAAKHPSQNITLHDLIAIREIKTFYNVSMLNVLLNVKDAELEVTIKETFNKILWIKEEVIKPNKSNCNVKFNFYQLELPLKKIALAYGYIPIQKL